jgi:hypothetical protein
MISTLIRATTGYTVARELSPTLANRSSNTTSLVDELTFSFLQETKGVSRQTLVNFVIAARRTIDKTIITEETAERFVRQLIADGVLETEEFRTYVYNDAERVAA